MGIGAGVVEAVLCLEFGILSSYWLCVSRRKWEVDITASWTAAVESSSERLSEVLLDVWVPGRRRLRKVTLLAEPEVMVSGL